jgi:hypothetical protein
MRPLLCAALIVVSGVVAGVFAGGGAAQVSTLGDGCLVVQSGFGKVTVTLTRGVVLGRYTEGYLLYNDQGGELNLPKATAAPTKSLTNDHVWKYSDATDVRFRATGPTKLTLNATFINLSVAGKGTASLSRSGLTGVPSTITPPSNAYSVDAASFCGDNYQKMPLTTTKVQISSPITGQ